MRIVLPIRTVSEKNQREHWSRRSGRVAAHRGTAKIACWSACYPLRGKSVTVVLTRIAPRALDPGDNIAAALSAVRDGVADALGTNDRDPLVTWKYDQRRGAAKEYSVAVQLVEAETNEETPCPEKRERRKRTSVLRPNPKSRIGRQVAM